ncbi:MAG: radical SAM protein [Pseudomonadota bacterium]|nr:radical SAM protein [Desulfobacterales bacterium]MBL6967419.1 radical SAM protein [Desulfobacteraceae bacterium]MBL7101437.1 radical SAM protein [Desulfobacteraceae bacterium]MBL7171768.1 radical SAM protein [Desulfobacteraceae bacterium]MBU0989223.1 radical SAM protein [Pseudomonadota bacterium]
MKILLIYPYCLEERLHEEDVGVLPIGLYYVGAALRENHYDCEILNWHDINKTPGLIKETLVEKRPDVIGFSVLHANRWGAIDISRIAKQVDPSVTIVFGGIGTTFLWEHFLTHFREIDFCVLREGEYPFLNLIKSLERGDRAEIERIEGIAFRKNERIVKTGDAGAIKELDELPDPSKYFRYQHVTSTRGCPGNCTFCGSPKLWERKVRFHSPVYFVHQLERLYEKGIAFFYFSDDTFMVRKDRVIEICKRILERDLKISWVAISHVDFVDEKLLYWMRKAGCVQISYGIESGSEKIRRLLNKGIRTEQIKKAFSLTIRYGILPRAYFIYGSPGETWATIQETIDLIRKIKPLSIIFYILDIFPGTALYSDFVKRSGVTDDIWLQQIEDIMYFETDPDLTEESILAFGEKLRAEFYAGLPVFVDSVDLIDKKEFYELHADFLSRLGMTFSHGDYAKIEAIRDKQKIAVRLYQRSLEYSPNDRAYLGLGIIRQQERNFQESVRILSEGVGVFPQNEQLHICLGLSYMNLGEYDKALSCFLKFRHSEQAASYIAECHRALGRKETGSALVK